MGEKICIKCIVWGPSPQWSAFVLYDQVLKLCSVLPGLTDHHHNKAYLASLSPYGERGQFLQRRVAYGMLRQLFDMEPNPSDKIENCKVNRRKICCNLRNQRVRFSAWVSTKILNFTGFLLIPMFYVLCFIKLNV